MKVKNISASSIKAFEQCPMKYHAIYDLGIEETSVHPLTMMGKAGHEMLELATTHRMTNSPAEQCDPMFWKASAVAKYGVQQDLLPLIDELIGNAVRWGYFRNVHRTVGCELRVEFQLPDGTNVKGFIDRMDVNPPKADIIDIKTQKKEFDGDELRGNWQASIYNIGARKIRPEIVGDVSVSFWVLRHQVQRVVLTSGDAERDVRRIMDKANEIRACENPEAKPSGLCPWCPYEKQCPDRNSSARDRFKKATRR